MFRFWKRAVLPACSLKYISPYSVLQLLSQVPSMLPPMAAAAAAASDSSCTFNGISKKNLSTGTPRLHTPPQTHSTAAVHTAPASFLFASIAEHEESRRGYLRRGCRNTILERAVEKAVHAESRKKGGGRTSERERRGRSISNIRRDKVYIDLPQHRALSRETRGLDASEVTSTRRFDIKRPHKSRQKTRYGRWGYKLFVSERE